MRNSTFAIFLVISISSTLIAVSFAQNFTERYLPEGAIARFGKGHIYDFVYSPDGQLLASGSRDNTVRLWEVETGNLLKTLAPHRGDVQNVVFSPDGSTLASASWEGVVCLWNSQTGELLETVGGPLRKVATVIFSPDGNRIVYGSDDKIYFWDIRAKKILRTLAGHTDVVDRLAYSSDGKTLVSGSRDGTILLWDLTKSALNQ